MDCYADGGVFRHEAEIQGDKLIFRGHGSTGEGVPTELTVVYTNIEEDSFTGQFINQKVGDKKLPDGKPYTFTRVKQ